MSNNRFRRLTDLFVNGRTMSLPTLPDGRANGYLWIQVINSYERDECLSDAQVARSRLVLALREDGDERLKMQARIAEIGREKLTQQLADLRVSMKTGEIASEMRSDPEWKERVEMVLRLNDDESALPPTEEEKRLQARVNADVLEEMARREDLERSYLQRFLTRLSDDEFLEEWVKEWIDRRGTTRAAAEYKLTEVWFATRWCEAQPTEDDNLDHSRCEGHRNRVFESKADARAADDSLVDMIKNVLDDLNIGGQDPKDSARPTSSSGSSPTPSAAEGSAPSTPAETPSKPPGPSSTPSLTP